MRLEAVTAEIRPRSDWEAVDLGLALIRRDFWRCFAVWWLALLAPAALLGWLLWEHPVAWLCLLWWLKPMGSRLVLFEISRRLFGEVPSWRSSLMEVPRVWVRRFFYRMLWARLSPWLPVTLAVEDLEGLRGKAYKQRCAQVSRRGDGVVMWLFFAADIGAAWLGAGFLVIVLFCIPDGQGGAWAEALESFDWSSPFELPLLISRTVVACLAVAMSLMDIFITGAGFGVYLNNRTWIEGWDVELAFKRMAKRLSRTLLPCLALLLVFSPASRAQPEETEAAGMIREVKAQPEFKVHTVTEKVPVATKSDFSWLEKLLRFLSFNGSLIEMLGQLLVISVIGLLVGLIAWLVWINRHALMRLAERGGDERPALPRARVVMGMNVSPETLPADVPSAALALWRAGSHQEALGLLYRGTISKVIDLAQVEIRESDTEGDCRRRVDEKGSAAHPGYFTGLTGIWVNMAYAGRRPQDHVVEDLCRQWPFSERRLP